MRIALCADWINETSIIERVHEGLKGEAFIIDSFVNPWQLADVLHENAYDAVLIAINGASGMEAVILVREHSQSAEIVWVTDDEQFGKIGYKNRVAMLLLVGCTAEALATGLRTAQERRKQHNHSVIRGQPGANRRVVGAW